MATLGSLAVLPDSGSTERFPRSFRLNPNVYPPAHAGGTEKLREGSRSTRSNLEPNRRQVLPANSNHQRANTAGQDACETHASMRALRLTKRVRSVGSRKQNRGALLNRRVNAPPAQQQKEYQCQES